MNFRLAQWAVIDTQIVDYAIKIITIGSPADIDINRRIYLYRGDCADQYAIIQHSIDIDIQGPGRGVIDARHMIPNIQ